MNYKDLLPSGRWHYEGQCSCGGTLTVKYEYTTDRTIKLRIKPSKNKFNLYSRRWCEWDKPLDDLQDIMANHGLASPVYE